VRSFYSLFLNLFPRAYRDEYGEELQAVFNLSLDDAMKIGWVDVTGVVLRELIGLPKAILYEHLRERRKANMTGKFASRFDFAPGSPNETLAALAPFLLFGALPTLLGYFRVSSVMPLWLEIIFVIVFLLFGLSLFVIGFAKGAPRWFMPYLGLPLPIISLAVFNGWLDEWDGFRMYGLYERSWFLGQFVFQGLLWVGLIGSIVLLVLAVRLIPKFHPFYKRLRGDWTLLCFVLYGAIPFALVLTFDEYKHEEPYMFAAFLILAAGGWLYLRDDVPLKKFLYLYVGVALSMLIAAVGKAAILPIQDWPIYIDPASWKPEAMSTFIMWMWLALIMLIPLALNLFPRSENSAHAT
jgi:hypothetical protein